MVYSPAAMAHLGAGGVIVHLDEELDVLRRRLLDLQTRGVVMGRNQDLAELHRSRLRLYRQIRPAHDPLRRQDAGPDRRPDRLGPWPVTPRRRCRGSESG